MKERDFPVLYSDESECCGCSACLAVCPRGAIAMKANRHGFLYPEIDEKLCIRCYKCIDVCSFKKRLG